MTERAIQAEIEELRGLSVPELAARFRDLFGWESPLRHRSFLTRRVAWKLQERRFGGLSEQAKARLEELMAEIKLPLKPKDPVAGKLWKWRRNAPVPGTVLRREYKGKEIQVTVRPDGIEYEGEVYRSLTAVAKVVTGGSKWNGRHFFGLTPRTKEKP